MDENSKLFWYMVLLFLVGTGALIYTDMTTNERMAKAGYGPLRLQGDANIYWLKVPDRSEKELLSH